MLGTPWCEKGVLGTNPLAYAILLPLGGGLKGYGIIKKKKL